MIKTSYRVLKKENIQNKKNLMMVWVFVVLALLTAVVIAQGTINLGVEGPYCGDSECQTGIGENCSNCETDCGVCPYCGDTMCNGVESCSTCPQDCGTCIVDDGGGGGGGGGGGVYIPIIGGTYGPGIVDSPRSFRTEGLVYTGFPFKMSKEAIKVLVKQGETVTETLKIRHNGAGTFDIAVLPSREIGRFMTFNRNEFTIIPAETEVIEINVTASKDEPPDVHIGKVVLSGNGLEDSINFIIVVSETQPLLNVVTGIKEDTYGPGDKITASIRAVPTVPLEKLNATLYYAIRNFEGDVWISKTEDISLEDEINLQRQLQIPKNTKQGDYVFYTKITVLNKTSIDADNFGVFIIEKPLALRIWPIIFISGILLIMLITIIVLLKKILVKPDGDDIIPENKKLVNNKQ